MKKSCQKNLCQCVFHKCDYKCSQRTQKFGRQKSLNSYDLNDKTKQTINVLYFFFYCIQFFKINVEETALWARTSVASTWLNAPRRSGSGVNTGPATAPPSERW